MDSNNVILFPRSRYLSDEEPLSVETVKHSTDMMRHYHVQETISTIAPMIFNQLDLAGFEIGDEESDNIKDGAFIIESIRSILCKHYDLYHPFQQIAENVFYPDGEDTNTLRIADSLNVTLKNSESN